MKPFSVVVIGEPTYINSLINCISYGPGKIISHRFKGKNSETIQAVQMNFGSLQVDEDHRIDFYGGNDDAILEFMDSRPDADFKGMIITLNADDSMARHQFKAQLSKHERYLNKYALVVGVSGNNYTAIKQTEEQVRNCLSQMNAVAPVFSIDPNNESDVSLLVESLLCFAAPGMQDNYKGKSLFASNDSI